MNIFHKQHLTRKAKKKAQLKKNKKHVAIYNIVRLRMGEAKRQKDLKDKEAKNKKKALSWEEKQRSDKKEIWSVKVSTIRNRLSDKKRTSEDRWNRFAGTSDGGGMGR